MKKIINGKRYSTETATKIGSWNNGYYQNDFDYCSEDLYRKRGGEFFLHGCGGARSCYANAGWGEQIVPLTYEQASKWVKDHLDEDTYESIFGEISEDNSKATMCISMTSAEADLIRKNALREGMSVSAYIVMKCTE